MEVVDGMVEQSYVPTIPKFPDVVTPSSRALANEAMRASSQENAIALRELIPIDQRNALATHYEGAARYNAVKRGSQAVQVLLQYGRARFLRGQTDVPPQQGPTFDSRSLE